MGIIKIWIVVILLRFFLFYIGIKVHRIIRLKPIKVLFARFVACLLRFMKFLSCSVEMALIYWVIGVLLTIFFGDELANLKLVLTIVGGCCIMNLIEICLTLFYHPASNRGFVSRNRRRVANEMNLSLDNDRKRVDRKIVFRLLKDSSKLVAGGVICYLLE